MAGPFGEDEFSKIIPPDKKLSKQWLASLYARSNPLSVSGDDLRFIGMPINGICTGQVYLGGDGQLWHWNLDTSRNYKKETAKGPRFMDPDVAHSPMSQGFALQVGSAGREKVFTLNAKGFQDVTFTNQYPMATVDHADDTCPVKVQLQAYTPFIPLNRDDSSYPVIVMRYTITNNSESEQEVAIAGWVENISNTNSGARAVGKKLCVYRELKDISTVECFANFQNPGSQSEPDYGNIALGVLGGDRPEIVDIARSQPDAAGIFSPKPDDLKHRAVSGWLARSITTRRCGGHPKR